MTHLIAPDEAEKQSYEWTRVFSIKRHDTMQRPLFPLAPDLNYDASMRDILSQSESYPGEILFSPLRFTAADLPSCLE